MLNRLRLWLARRLAGSDHVVISREANRIVLLPGATLECMRCENQYPLGETGLARYLSERGCNELGLKRGSACVSTAAPSVGSRKARGAADKCSSGVSRVMPHRGAALLFAMC